MFIRSVVALLAWISLGILALADPQSITLNYQVINNFPVKYVAINMNDPDVVVTTAVASSFPHRLNNWSTFISRLRPDAAINGTYFCTRNYQPVGDVAVNGDLLYRGSVGTALAITPDNRVAMLPGPRQAKSNWSGYRTILCAGPRLLTDGQLTINARAEGFRDPRVLGSAPRSAVAYRKDGLLLFITVAKNISLSNLGYICMKLGAQHAMTLDGGSSSGLYAKGRTVTQPSRSISNVLVAYANPARFRNIAWKLVPSNTRVISRLLPDFTTKPEMPIFTMQGNPQALFPSSTFPNIQLLEPSSINPVSGTTLVKALVTAPKDSAWSTLSIDGKVRAMTNTSFLEYHWDSTQETDGEHTLEVAAWSPERTLLATESRLVTVDNHAFIATK